MIEKQIGAKDVADPDTEIVRERVRELNRQAAAAERRRQEALRIERDLASVALEETSTIVKVNPTTAQAVNMTANVENEHLGYFAETNVLEIGEQAEETRS